MHSCPDLFIIYYYSFKSKAGIFTKCSYTSSYAKFDVEIDIHDKFHKKFVKTVKSTFEIKPFSVVAIQNIITHEFGHALGLGHYQITDTPIYTVDRPWQDISIMYYSINPADNEVAEPKYVDIKMVEKIYKKDGFGGSVSPPLKVGYYTTGDREICTHKCNIFRQ